MRLNQAREHATIYPGKASIHMDKQIPVRALADLAPGQELNSALKQYRRELTRALQGMGFGHVEYADEARSFATRFESKAPDRPDITARLNDRQVCICLPPVAEQLMALGALSESQCTCCDEQFADHDVYYAALIAAPRQHKLYLLGPVPVRLGQSWAAAPALSQFLPLSRRSTHDRYSAIFGGAALFKLEQHIIPHVLEHGQLPRFSVQGLFTDKEQGEHGLYALMGAEPPTHFMLLASGEGGHEFRRPFFFYGEAPRAELELTRPAEGPMVELLEKTGRTLYAECLEATLFPGALLPGKHYRCTLSLVADRCRPLQREFTVGAGPLREQVVRDYRRTHGEEPPSDFAVRVSTEALRSLYQEPRRTHAELCGKVVHVERTAIDGCPATRIGLLPIPQNDEIEVQVFVGDAVGMEKLPEPGDVIECSGYLYVSPDAMLAEAESWQDSGEVAALQNARELSAKRLKAYDRYSGYSLAQGVVAAAFAGADYNLAETPTTHTRDEATFTVQSPTGEQRLLFVDTIIGHADHTYHYSPEQQAAILSRMQEKLGSSLTAHHCIVSLQREPESECYTVQLSVQPECPGIDPRQLITEATQCPLPGKALDEARACRITCNAICTQNWTEFARAAAEDMTYTSLVNGTYTAGKIEFIRYMAERQKLWVEQQGWAGMSMDTGTILYKGERRPCYMITCYGRMIGAAVVTLRHGLIDTMETVPLEVNNTFEKDRECADPPVIFHPLRGHVTPHPALQTPLQRFANAYLQESMLRRTGLIGHPKSTKPGGARWLKIARNEPSLFDSAFTYAGHIYAVCAIETTTHPDHGGNIGDIIAQVPERDRLLALAEAQGLIPCVFPAMRNYTPDLESSWNLWDMRTHQLIFPEDATPGQADASAWEILCSALVKLCERVAASGGQLLAYHDTPDLLPHLWFTDARGQLSWVIVRTHCGAEPPDRALSEAERRACELTPGTQGYVVDVTAYGDAAGSTPARHGMPLHMRISEPQPLSDH